MKTSNTRFFTKIVLQKLTEIKKVNVFWALQGLKYFNIFSHYKIAFFYNFMWRFLRDRL